LGRKENQIIAGGDECQGERAREKEKGLNYLAEQLSKVRKNESSSGNLMHEDIKNYRETKKNKLSARLEDTEVGRKGEFK